MVGKNRVTIFLSGQFIIVYTCKPHINRSLVIITPRIFSSKMLYLGWWERSWLNLYDRYDHKETRLLTYNKFSMTSLTATNSYDNIQYYISANYSISLMFLLRLYATIGIFGHSIFNVGSLSIRCQCFCRIWPICVVSVLKGMLSVSRVSVLFGLSL